MALYKGDKRYALSTNNPGNVVPLEVTQDGVFTAPSGVDGYSPVTIKNCVNYCNYGSHTDANGVWHKPPEWDDIESIDLTNKHEVYFLCACHRTTHDWFRIRFYGGGTLKWSYGHVSNGTYTIHADSTETTVSSGAYISLFLGNIADDYIVVRITSTSYISSCTYQNWAATSDLNCAMPARFQSVLMRYGRMPKGNSLSTSATYCLESDNILDFAKDYQNTTTAITVSDAYSNAFSLQRWRCDGWNLAKNKITSFYCMFYNCICLSDTPNPLNLDGWVTSNTTSLNSTFYNCTSLISIVSVRNWDLSNITTMAALFYYCRSIRYINGIETWNSAPKCTNISNLFSNCITLINKIDVSNCNFGNGTANLTTVNDAFTGLSCCPEIDISNMNLSKVTSMSNFIPYSRSIKQLTMNNFTVPSSTCTNFNNLFNNSAIHEMIFNGWDFSAGSGNNTAQNIFASATGLKKVVFKNCTTPSNTINDTTSQFSFRYSYNLEYLDISFLDMSVFSNTITHTQSFRDLYSLVHFYPPKNISKSFNLTNDNQLSHDSLLRIINNLITVSTTQTLTIGTYNLSKLTDAEKAIATGKGWTLA